MLDPTQPTLWHFPYSHLCEKVRWVLDYKRISFSSRILAPGLHVPTMLKLSGQPLAPVMRCDGGIIIDSTAIVLYLEDRFPERPLLPADATQCKKIIALEHRFDGCFGDDMRSLFYHAYWPDWNACAQMSTQYAQPGDENRFRKMRPLLKPLLFFKMGLGGRNIAAAIRRALTALDALETTRAGRPYLVGGSFSLADLSAAALMSSLLGAAEYPYALPDPIAPNLTALRKRVAHHGAIQWARGLYRKHRTLATCG